uniref:Uncharacterized protein n=1 Tax=Romanomermis culicivorax TaxID=13658 RepID=A0A915HQJ1_ROMCU
MKESVLNRVNEPSVILNKSLAMMSLHRSFQNEWSLMAINPCYPIILTKPLNTRQIKRDRIIIIGSLVNFSQQALMLEIQIQYHKNRILNIIFDSFKIFDKFKVFRINVVTAHSVQEAVARIALENK